MDLAVIGMGLMGTTLCRHLLADGHTVIGFDPDAARRSEHAERGGRVAESAAEAAGAAEIAVLSLPNSHVTLEVATAIAATAPAGLLVLDTTTGEPDHAVAAAEILASASIGFVDATISGNAAQFAAKDVIFMLGGAPDLVQKATPLLRDLSRAVYHVGPVGAGSRTKLIVNHVLSIHRAALAEALTVAEKADLNLESVLAVLRDSTAYSKAMDVWGERMLAGDHFPPASRMRQSHKDSRIICAHAEAVGASHAVVDVVRGLLAEAEESGLSDADNSGMMEVMRRRADVGRVPRE